MGDLTCCFVGCGSLAHFEIVQLDPPLPPSEGYTHACMEHVGDLLTDAARQEIVRLAPAPESPGAGGGDRTGARPTHTGCGTCTGTESAWRCATHLLKDLAEGARRSAARPEAVPHHAADGRLRHYCSRDHCPDFTEGSMVRIQEPAPRPKPCADCDEPDDSHHPLCVQAPPSVEGLPEETLAEMEACSAPAATTDEPPECAKCGDEFTVPYGLEVTAVCDLCAQQIVHDLLPALLTSYRRLRAQVAAGGGTGCKTCGGTRWKVLYEVDGTSIPCPDCAPAAEQKKGGGRP